MQFASDNWAGASPKVIDALEEAARAGGPAYGSDAITRSVEQRFSELFEHEVAVFMVASGTFANALGISAYARPGGLVLCHREAHINTDEAGATEFFGAGLKIAAIDGAGGKLAPAPLAEELARHPEGFLHHGQPVVVSITQMTELGTVYRPEEIVAIAEVARSRGCALHMDGARFANAVATLGVSPADVTWRAGVDVLSFGGTKNGCLAAEAVVVFNPAHARDVGFARQRAGQGFSKNWFIAAQFSAYLDSDHWLDLARNANAMAARLADAIGGSTDARLALTPDGNEVFVILRDAADARLKAAGAAYHPWAVDSLAAGERPKKGEGLFRLVTSWRSTAADVEHFAEHLRGGQTSRARDVRGSLETKAPRTSRGAEESERPSKA
jgi:threonine aldolase